MQDTLQDITQLLHKLYPTSYNTLLVELTPLLSPLKKEITQRKNDVILVTYPNSIQSPNEKNLQTLKWFLDTYIKDAVSILHILPFWKATSDDGFAISDYTSITPAFGTWSMLRSISKKYMILADVVLNHVSSQHPWFLQALKQDNYYKDFFYSYTIKPIEQKSTFRPRTSQLYTPFTIKSQTHFFQTTFSPDQIDLNFENPNVFLSFVKIIRTYVQHNIHAFRLDAILYLFQNGIEEQNEKIQLLISCIKKIITLWIPQNLLISEVHTTVTHAKTYLTKNTSDLIYHFELSALLLHTLYTQDATKITNWLEQLQPYTTNGSFIHFTSTHDGISLHTVIDILSKDEFSNLIQTLKKNGSLLSYKTKGDVTEPYEANCTFLDACASIPSFLASKYITLALRGVALVYISDFFAAHNWNEGVTLYQSARKINRETFQKETIQEFLQKDGSPQHTVYSALFHALHVRKSEKLFHHSAQQKILSIHPSIICIKRYTTDSQLLCVTNISKKTIRLSMKKIFKSGYDILHLEKSTSTIILQAYQTKWIKVV